MLPQEFLGLDGKEQNPLRETTFLEEFCWFCNFSKKRRLYFRIMIGNEISIVPKNFVDAGFNGKNEVFL